MARLARRSIAADATTTKLKLYPLWLVSATSLGTMRLCLPLLVTFIVMPMAVKSGEIPFQCVPALVRLTTVSFFATLSSCLSGHQ